MEVIIKPKKNEWEEYALRPTIDRQELDNLVKQIVNDVQLNGDDALYRYAKSLDKVVLAELNVDQESICGADNLVSEELKTAIRKAKDNIEKFHKAQIGDEKVIETTPGVKCWRRSVGIEKVGLYIPGGSAPLFSTILMLGIPAQLAGCKEVILCTPPNQNGKINPAILYTAKLVGINTIYKVGGAQAIAAMAYGTESISKMYKIFGPGNQYVTKAKELVQQEGIAIDMPAGPSEVLIIADKSCKPSFVAADLLSQAEHGADSQVILLSDNATVIEKVNIALAEQLVKLPRKELACLALINSKAIQLNSIKDCIDFSNEYAPEHLIIASDIANEFADKIINAGSVFLGNYSCESAGDYASGTNHTLPTNGYAKNYSGVSVDSFVKKITFQQLDKKGIKNIGNTIELMAEAEELFAHKNAVTIRLKQISYD